MLRGFAETMLVSAALLSIGSGFTLSRDGTIGPVPGPGNRISRAARPGETGSGPRAGFTPEQIRQFGFLPRGTEIPQLGDANSRHFSNGDGSITARIQMGGGARADTTALEDTSSIDGNHSGRSQYWEVWGWLDWVDAETFIAAGRDFNYGNLKEAGWEEWPTASIPTGSTITAIRCTLRFFPSTEGYPAPTQVPIFDVGPTEPYTYSNGPLHYVDDTTGYSYGNFPTAGLVSQSWVWADLNSQAQTDLQNSLARGWWGIGIAPYNDYSEAEFRSHLFSMVTERPILLVTYTPGGSAHDIYLLRINAPVGSVDSGTVVTPSCSLYNWGASTETYSVRMKFGTFYGETTTVSGHQSHQRAYATFPSFAAWPRGTFPESCYAMLITDENRHNDTIGVTLTANVHDVACTQILAPLGAVDSGTSYTPACSVYNYGTSEENAWVRMRIGGYFSERNINPFEAGGRHRIYFDAAADWPRGTLVESCYVVVDGDANRHNDTLVNTITGHVHDVRVSTIKSPTGAIDSVQPVVPACSVFNRGSQTETSYQVHMKIGSFYEESTATGTHAPGDTVYVTFPLHIGWPRGTQVESCFTSLAGDANRHNDTLRSTFDVSVADVGVTAIKVPSGTVDSGQSVAPACSVYNHGTTTASYSVRMRIGNFYDQAASTNSHAPGTYVFVTFPAYSDWPRGSYRESCYTELGTDMDRHNDTVWSPLTGLVHDVGCTEIEAPTGSVEPGTSQPVRARVRNDGNASETFAIRFWIDDDPVYDQTITKTVLAGAESTFSFSDWNPVQPGTRTVACSTRLASDVVQGNDKHTGQVEVGLPDVSVVAIVAPTGLADSGTSQAPCAMVHNDGGTAQTFDIAFRIDDGYRELITRTVGPGADSTFAFPVWTALLRGQHVVQCSTKLLDRNPANDAKDDSIFVQVRDVQALAIISPPNSVRQDSTFECAGRIRNAGTQGEDFRVVFEIRRDTALVAADSLPVTVAGGAEADVVVFSTALVPLGSYQSRLRVELIPDMHYENDTVSGTFLVASRLPSGWFQKADMLPGGKRKKVKDGGALTYAEGIGGVGSGGDAVSPYIYSFKGNNRVEFYRYDLLTNTWTTKESIPPLRPGSTRKKSVKKGAALAAGTDMNIYAVKGNNSYEFWRYNPFTGQWLDRRVVPLGLKAVREGAGMAGVKIGSTDYIYLLKGSKTVEFYRYNVQGDAWEQLADAPYGSNNRPFRTGSCITYDNTTRTIYALKATYNQFYAYDIMNNTWTTRDSLPWIHPSGLRKKKVKDGACMAFVPDLEDEAKGVIYALKGGNTQEFWSYRSDSNEWLPETQIPFAPTANKRVKGGGAMIYSERNHTLYALKGNNTAEFWQYVPASKAPTAGGGTQNTQTGSLVPSLSYSLEVEPNPFTRSLSPGVSFTLPVAGNAELKLYNIAGGLVATLAQGRFTAGNYCIALSGQRLAAGVYLLKFVTAEQSLVRKLMVE